MKPFLSEAFLVFMHWCLPLYTRCHSATRHIALAAFKKVSILACLRVIRLTQNWNQPFYQVFATWVIEVSSWIFFYWSFKFGKVLDSFIQSIHTPFSQGVSQSKSVMSVLLHFWKNKFETMLWHLRVTGGTSAALFFRAVYVRLIKNPKTVDTRVPFFEM